MRTRAVLGAAVGPGFARIVGRVGKRPTCSHMCIRIQQHAESTGHPNDESLLTRPPLLHRMHSLGSHRFFSETGKRRHRGPGSGGWTRIAALLLRFD